MRTTAINEVANTLRRITGDRPFLGGIDSAHTILYFAKYGRALVPVDDEGMESAPVRIDTIRYPTSLHGAEDFIDLDSIQAYRSGECASNREVTCEGIMQWLSAYPPEVNENAVRAGTLEIYPSGDFVAMREDDSANHGEAYHALKKLLLVGRDVA